MLGLVKFAAALAKRPVLALLATGVATKGFGLFAAGAATGACDGDGGCGCGEDTPAGPSQNTSALDSYKQKFGASAVNLKNFPATQFATAENHAKIVLASEGSDLYVPDEEINISPSIFITPAGSGVSVDSLLAANSGQGAYMVWYAYDIRPRGESKRTCAALFTFPGTVTIPAEGDFDILAQSTTQENISDQLNPSTGTIPLGCEMVFDTAATDDGAAR